MRENADLGKDADALAALDRAGMPEPPPVAMMPSLARRGRGATLNPPVRYRAAVHPARSTTGGRR